MFEVPGSDIRCVCVDEEVAKGKKAPEYVYETKEESSEGATQANRASGSV